MTEEKLSPKAPKEKRSSGLTKKQIETINRNFPKDSVRIYKQVISSSGELMEFTGRAAPYIIERLNEVFGHGWSSDVQEYHSIKDWGVTAIVKLSFWIGNKQYCHTQAGACKYLKDKGKIDPGETLKGAITNGLMKCSSHLGIGLDAYKGQLKPTDKARELYLETGEIKVSEWEGIVNKTAEKKNLVNRKEIYEYITTLLNGGIVDPSTYKRFPQTENDFRWDDFKEMDWQKLNSCLKLSGT